MGMDIRIEYPKTSHPSERILCCSCVPVLVCPVTGTYRYGVHQESELSFTRCFASSNCQRCAPLPALKLHPTSYIHYDIRKLCSHWVPQTFSAWYSLSTILPLWPFSRFKDYKITTTTFMTQYVQIFLLPPTWGLRSALQWPLSAPHNFCTKVYFHIWKELIVHACVNLSPAQYN